MVKSISFFTGFLFLCISFLCFAEEDRSARYLKDKKFLERIKNRQVHVESGLVKTVLKDKIDYFFLVSGQVKMPLDRTADIVQDYKNYNKVIPFVDRSEFDPKTNTVVMEASLLGYSATTVIKMEKKKRDDGSWKIRWTCVGGSFVGSKGAAEIYPLRPGSIVFLSGNIIAGKLKIPKIILNFGFQYMLKRSAIAMRDRIESGK